MFRPLGSRRFIGIAVAASVGTGIGAGAVGLWSVAGADTPAAPRAATAAAIVTAPAPGQLRAVSPTTAAPPPAGAPASSPLTVDQATAIATQASPGRVVEVQQDNEPTGPRYEVTLRHEDGTSTEIEVDAVTGLVVGTEHDDDRDGD
ncbi:MAG: hypothetical protein JWR41_1201 [Modestobacter sp.]|jgi:hypothetical protein|nr:hypothetical protein [Modestobacter sp.]